MPSRPLLIAGLLAAIATNILVIVVVAGTIIPAANIASIIVCATALALIARTWRT